MPLLLLVAFGAAFFGASLPYLLRGNLPAAPSTSSAQEPYTPPFTGGQCNGVAYRISYRIRESGGTYIALTNIVNGAVSVDFNTGQAKSNGNVVVTLGTNYTGGNPANLWQGKYSSSSLFIDSVVRVDGQADTCGNLPNPNPQTNIPVDGIASSAAPSFANGVNLQTGVAYPSGDGGLGTTAINNFNEAGVLAPTNIAGALAKIAAGLAALADLSKLIKDILDILKEVSGRDNKTSFRIDLGLIQKDGFLRLFPDNPSDKISAIYLDITMQQVKSGLGKIYGEKSPNLYPFTPLGYIHFVSPTFGVISSHKIGSIRASIEIPNLAYGFFYNMGLDGVNKANVSAFYLKIEK